MTEQVPRAGDQVSTAEQLAALPDYSLLVDEDGNHAVKIINSTGREWCYTAAGYGVDELLTAAEMVYNGDTYTVAYVPGQQPSAERENLTADELLDTDAGLELADMAWSEGSMAMLHAINSSRLNGSWVPPTSPYLGMRLKRVFEED